MGNRILWLASWYPSRVSPFNGDFIQRHARAASLYAGIDVLHVVEDRSESSRESVTTNQSSDGNLTETVICFRTNGLPGVLHKLYSNWQYRRIFKKAIRDYIHAHGKPVAIHVHVAMKAGMLALWAKRKYGIPFFVTEHWGIYNDIVHDHYATRSKFFRFFTQKIMEGASGLSSVSAYVGEGINRLVVPKSFTVIRNTVDTRLFFYMPVTPHRFRFIHVSNMIYLKNPEGILRAFQALLQTGVEAELLMVGDTDPQIRDYAESLHFPETTVRFLGEIPYEAVAKEMQAAHALLLFSNIENSPCVIGEALCCGLPVIVTRTGGIPELVNETNSILIAPGDEAALTRAMATMVQEPGLFRREQIALAAKDIFSYAIIGKELVSLVNMPPVSIS
jgi:glycosyltransferase involved in cell wall biosynthesis